MIICFNKLISRKSQIFFLRPQVLKNSYLAKLKDLKIPCFKVKSEDIIILNDPKIFHQNLNSLIASSKKRIVLSSLYIGTGELEENLVKNIETKLNENKNLNATILLDFTRATREDKNKKSSKSLLLPLLKYPNINLNFFLSPNFSNFLLKKTVLPLSKYNEIIALQHMKIYVFDDNFIISGANLNHQYFVNRQDRYILVKNKKELADYFEKLVNLVGKISLSLKSDGSFTSENDPLDIKNKKLIRLKIKSSLDNLKKEYFNIENYELLSNEETLILPLIQMYNFNIKDDEIFTKFIFENLKENSYLKLASGYFNLTQKYQNSIFKSAEKSKIDLIMASEEVNSFYNANGIIKHIPSIYTEISRNFFKNLKDKKLENIKLFSYFRDKWTFHVKGLWLQDSSDYFLSLIGSPNFGYRSVYKDLELQLAFLTKNKNLIKQFSNEFENIQKYSKNINSEEQLPYVNFWLKIITKLIKKYF